jgi:hypothetical protein
VNLRSRTVQHRPDARVSVETASASALDCADTAASRNFSPGKLARLLAASLIAPGARLWRTGADW